MDLSVVDLSPVSDGGTATEAYENTLESARQAERLGFTRFWVAEHHGRAANLAGTTPEVLLGRLTGETDSIRLGSGAVLLNNYSPFKIAEVFGALDGLAPGRIDAGLGRANGSPAVDQALGTERHVENPDEDHRERVEAVVNHLYDEYPDDHVYGDLEIPRSAAEPPVPWLLGSSPSSAAPAGELGLRYCFAGFIRPQFAEYAFEEYHERFRPSPLAGGVEKPHGTMAVNAICAETDEKAARLRSVSEAAYKRRRRGIDAVPTVDEAIDELGGVPDPTPERLPDDEWPRAISGSPETMRGLLEGLADRVGVDEVMIQHIVADHADALRSHELLAEAVGLDGR